MKELSKADAIKMIELASKKAGKYAEMLCNGWQYEKNITNNDFDVADEAKWTANVEGRYAYWIAYAEKIAEYTDLTLTIQGDPRGEIILIN